MIYTFVYLTDANNPEYFEQIIQWTNKEDYEGFLLLRARVIFNNNLYMHRGNGGTRNLLNIKKNIMYS